jgi:hypothetical protein
MSRPIVVEEPIGDLAIVAIVNGSARASVYVLDAVTRAQLSGDTVTLAKASERTAFSAAHLPLEHQALGERALLQLAARVDAARAERHEKKETAAEGDKSADEPWPEEVAGPALLSSLRRQLARYVLVSEPALVAIVLWIAHTYVTLVADYTPYLLLTSPVRECGKSTLLEMLQWLAFRAQLTGGITAAALYRRIGRLRGEVTMLLDEIDTRLRGDGGEALRGVLNTGFHRSGKMTICVGEDHEEKDFPTYCPKVLAGIGKVWDTVASRSISIRMVRASKEEIKKLSRVRGDLIAGECAPYRRQLMRWASDNQESLRSADPSVPDALGARHADVWRPLLAIADAAGGEWPALARQAAVALHGVNDDEGDFGLLMLQDVRDIMGDSPVIFTERLLRQLIEMDDRPWSEYGRFDKPITARGLASLLGRFGVKPGTVRLHEDTGKGYALQKLAPAFLRYLPAPSAESVTSVTNPIVVAIVTDVTDAREGVRGGENAGVITSPNGDQALTPARIAEIRAERNARRSSRSEAA